VNRILLALILVLPGLVAPSASAQEVDIEGLDLMTAKYQMCMQVGTPGTPSWRFIYTNLQARLFAYKVKDGELVKDWETVDLGSKAVSVFVKDIYGDGAPKLVVATIRGRVLIYDMDTYDLEYESLNLGFQIIDYMTYANLDQDPQDEVVLIADTKLFIIDALNKNIQWVSDTGFKAAMIVTANVDDDPQLEIILNTGRVIDSRFFNIEFEADGTYGDRITLFDINNDGYPDVFGEFVDFSIRVYDIWAQRELW